MEYLFSLVKILQVLLLTCVLGQVRTEWCTNWNDDDNFIYCDSCCGDWPYENCCDTELIGIIVGSVVGALFLISIIICVICVFVKQKGKSGRVINPQGGHQPQIYSTTVVHQAPYMQQGIIQPPPYPPPPAYPPNGPALYGHPPPAAPQPGPEGIQSQPPMSGGMPANHKVV